MVSRCPSPLIHPTRPSIASPSWSVLANNISDSTLLTVHLHLVHPQTDSPPIQPCWCELYIGYSVLLIHLASSLLPCRRPPPDPDRRLDASKTTTQSVRSCHRRRALSPGTGTESRLRWYRRGGRERACREHLRKRYSEPPESSQDRLLPSQGEGDLVPVSPLTRGKARPPSSPRAGSSSGPILARSQPDPSPAVGTNTGHTDSSTSTQRASTVALYYVAVGHERW